MDSHAFDLGARRTGALQSAHRHKQAIAFSNQKCSPILEIHLLDRIDIIIPGTTPQVGSGLLHGMHMHIFDGCSIGRLIPAQGEHETCPHTSSRIARLSNGAMGCLYLLRKGSYPPKIHPPKNNPSYRLSYQSVGIQTTLTRSHERRWQK